MLRTTKYTPWTFLPKVREERGGEPRSRLPPTHNCQRLASLPPHPTPQQGLFEQFRRFANLYFLLIAAISLTPVSPLSPVTNITPLVAVVAASLVKEGVEDAKRASKDRALNGRGVDVWAWGEESAAAPATSPPPSTWRRVAWRDGAVGDVVRVVKGDPFPADMVILTSSNAEGEWVGEEGGGGQRGGLLSPAGRPALPTRAC